MDLAITGLIFLVQSFTVLSFLGQNLFLLLGYPDMESYLSSYFWRCWRSAITFAIGITIARIASTHKKVFELLQNFALDRASCFCCSVNHVLEDGTKISCDRDLVYEHVRRRYGSLERFDESVRTSLKMRVQEHLGGDDFLFTPYQYAVVAHEWKCLAHLGNGNEFCYTRSSVKCESAKKKS